MSSDLDKFLDHVDQWKYKLHDELGQMTPAQRKAFWRKIHDEAHSRRLPVVPASEPSRQPSKRVRRTG
jgi:hypothetical protein